MSAARKLAPVESAPDPRAALRAAIAARTEAEAAAANLREALARAAENSLAAMGAHDDAVQAIETAKALDAAAIATHARGGGDLLALPSATRSARIAERDAADRLAAAREGKAQLQAALQQAETALSFRKMDVETARNEVLAPYVDTLCDAVRAAMAELNKRRKEMIAAACGGAGRNDVLGLFTYSKPGDGAAPANWTNPWAEAATGLLADADYPLPSVD